MARDWNGWQTDETLFLGIAGKRIEARCWGPPPEKAPTLVLLHEGLGCVSLWRDFPQMLGQRTGCGVFAYSRAGYGQSDPAELPRPIDYMSREAGDVLPGVLTQIGLQSGCLIGHSDGASIAAIYAGQTDDSRIKGLCLIAPHFFAEPCGLASITEAKTAFETTDLKMRLARHHADPENAFWGWNRAWLDPNFRQWNIEEVIADISHPVLAIQGREDQYGTLAQIERLENGLTTPFESLILNDCHHAPQFEQPDPTIEAIAAFIGRYLHIQPSPTPRMNS